MMVESSRGTEARWTGGAADGPAGVRLRVERPNQWDALTVTSTETGLLGGVGGSGPGGVRVADEVGDGGQPAGGSMGLAQRGHEGATSLGLVLVGVGEKWRKTMNVLSRICTLTPVSPAALLAFCVILASEWGCQGAERLYPCGDLFSISPNQARLMSEIANSILKEAKASYPNEGCFVVLTFYSFRDKPKGFGLVERLEIPDKSKAHFVKPKVSGYSLVSIDKEHNLTKISEVSAGFAHDLLELWEFHALRTSVFEGYFDYQGFHQYFGCNSSSFSPVMGACHLPEIGSPIATLAELAEKIAVVGMENKTVESLRPSINATLKDAKKTGIGLQKFDGMESSGSRSSPPSAPLTQ